MVWLVILATGCASVEEKEPLDEPVRIDLRALQHELGIEFSPNWVGYSEKRFDACRFAAQLPKNFKCSRAYFVQVGIQLSCRPDDEDQNPSLESAELTPVGYQEVSWQMGETSGRLSTDAEGHGLIQAIASHSMKSKRLRVSTGEDFLMMRAEQATRIVTPAHWCR